MRDAADIVDTRGSGRRSRRVGVLLVVAALVVAGVLAIPRLVGTDARPAGSPGAAAVRTVGVTTLDVGQGHHPGRG
jgi:hypothetical protein